MIQVAVSTTVTEIYNNIAYILIQSRPILMTSTLFQYKLKSARIMTGFT